MLLDTTAPTETISDTPPAPAGNPKPRKRVLAGIAPTADRGPRYDPGRRREAKPIPRYLKLTPAQIAAKIEKLGAYIREHGTAGLAEYEAALTRELIAKSAGEPTKPDNSLPDPRQVTVDGDLASARMFSRPKPKAAKNASYKPRRAAWPNAGAHRVDVTPGSLTRQGQTYSVTYGGHELIKDSRTPALDAARALLARGITGAMEVYGGELYPRLVVDIERAAGLTVQDCAQGWPVFRPYQPTADEQPATTN